MAEAIRYTRVIHLDHAVRDRIDMAKADVYRMLMAVDAERALPVGETVAAIVEEPVVEFDDEGQMVDVSCSIITAPLEEVIEDRLVRACQKVSTGDLLRELWRRAKEKVHG